MSEVRTAVFAGGEMDYLSFGNGKKTLVILPGLAIHSVMRLKDAVEKAYSIFAEYYTVYLFDHVDKLRRGYSVLDAAEDTASAMKAIGVKKADVLGVSFGGMTAIYLSSRHPELVHSLVLGSTISTCSSTFRAVVSTWLEKAEKKDEEGLISSFADFVYSEKSLAQAREVFIAANRGVTENEYERFIILSRAALDYSSRGELAFIRCPVLVIGSDGDRVATAAESRKISDALGCELYLYDSSYGHAVYDEAPDYKKRCLAFFNSHE